MTVQDRPFTVGTRGKVVQQRPEGSLKPDMENWKAEALRRLGWKSKTDKHYETYALLDDTTQSVLQKGMRGQGPYGATITSELVEGSGETFSRYHRLLTVFEQTEKRTPEMVAEMKEAAQAYIDHFNEYGPFDKKDKKNIAKRDTCAATLKELRKFEIAHECQALGEPPWNSAQAMKAASLKTTLDISSLPPGQQQVETLDEGTASPTFWINRGDGKGGKDKTFIFKPSSVSHDPDFANGGEPGREALAGRVAEMLNGALGLRLPMPETQIVSLGRESLPENGLNMFKEKIGNKESYVGSVQQFEQSEGSMHTLDGKGRDRISTRSTQELAIFDLITLNTDRHPGNLLVRTVEGGEKQLVPIDHGLTFPPRGAFRIGDRIGSSGTNALLQLPGSHKPFTPELLQSIDKLDPDAMAEALKRERATLEDAHPETKGTLPDDAIEISRRSAMFLKRAASSLTPATIQFALSSYHPELFQPDLDLKAFNTLADGIIGELKEDQDALKEYFLVPREMQVMMENDLQNAGWVGKFSNQDSLLRNPAVGLKIWKMGIRSEDLLGDAPDRQPIDLNENTEKELETIKEAFPGTKIPTEDEAKSNLIGDWREWTELHVNPEELEKTVRLMGVDRGKWKKYTENLVTALNYLKRGRALQAALKNGGTDTALFDIRKSVEYIRGLIPVLPPDERTNAESIVTRFEQRLGEEHSLEKSKIQVSGMLKVKRDELIDSARIRLLSKYKILIDGDNDEKTSYEIKKERDQVVSYNIIGGYENLKKRNAQLAEAD